MLGKTFFQSPFVVVKHFLRVTLGASFGFDSPTVKTAPEKMWTLAACHERGVLLTIAPDIVKICKILRLKGKVEKVVLLIDAKYTAPEAGSQELRWLDKRAQHEEYNEVCVRPSKRCQELLSDEAKQYVAEATASKRNVGTWHAELGLSYSRDGTKERI